VTFIFFAFLAWQGYSSKGRETVRRRLITLIFVDQGLNPANMVVNSSGAASD